MRGLKFGAGLLAALVLHFLGVSISGGFSQVLDLFLVVTLFNALDGDLVAGPRSDRGSHGRRADRPGASGRR